MVAPSPTQHPDFQSCTDWQSIVAEHRSTIRIPPHLVSPDPALTEWWNKANQSLNPPSDDKPGPSLKSLLSKPETAAILAKASESLPDPRILDGKDASGLVQLTKSGQVSVEQLTTVYLARAAIAQQATGCLSHFFPQLALQQAKELDKKRAQLAAENKLDQLGSLFGLPMTIKGHLNYAGQGSHRGFAFDVLPSPSSHPLVKANLSQEQIQMLEQTQGGYVSEAESLTASILVQAGAVIIGKTTMPQAIMHLDDRSNLHGQTLNPWNLALSPGGSSGGESAVIASGGSALGVGSDIGGSIRQPSGVCNLYGLRPTTLRLPYTGIRSTMPGNEGVGSSIGPMALSLRDVELFMSSVVNEQTRPWEKEHSLLRLPWRKVDSLLSSVQPRRKITLGVMLQDGVVTPTAPVRRALTHWVDKLKAFSQSSSAAVEIELKLWEPKDLHNRAWNIIRSLYFMDSGKLIRTLAKATGEPLLPLTQFIMAEPFVRSDTVGQAEMTTSEVWSQVRTREAFRKEFLAQWNQLGLDCLLCPVMSSVAPRPGKIRYWGYTSVFNLVDYPGVVFPSGMFADSKLDEAYEAQEAAKADPTDVLVYKQVGSDLSGFDHENRVEYSQHRAVFDGAPIGLQLIGRRFHDEELVKYAELLEHICKQG